MSEKVFEHTASITGLTCKPLSILSEPISTQEMSRARGGNDGGRPHNVDTRLDPGTIYNDLQKQYGGNSCPQECPLPCCEKDPDPGGVEGGLPTGTGGGGGEGGPSRITGLPPSTGGSYTSADSSGTQDQNGGALDNVDEEPDWEEGGQEDDKSVTDHVVDFFMDIYNEFDDAFNMDNYHPEGDGNDPGSEDGEDGEDENGVSEDEDNGRNGDN